MIKNELYSILFIIIILFNLVNCSDNNYSYNDKAMRMGEQYFLNDLDLKNYKNEALLGSIDSAWKIYLYYTFYNYDNELSVYWLKISAENGHVTGEYNFAYYLMEQHEYKRALFWARKAERNGEKDAKELIKLIDEKQLNSRK